MEFIHKKKAEKARTKMLKYVWSLIMIIWSECSITSAIFTKYWSFCIFIKWSSRGKATEGEGGEETAGRENKSEEAGVTSGLPTWRWDSCHEEVIWNWDPYITFLGDSFVNGNKNRKIDTLAVMCFVFKWLLRAWIWDFCVILLSEMQGTIYIFWFVLFWPPPLLCPLFS